MLPGPVHHQSGTEGGRLENPQLQYFPQQGFLVGHGDAPCTPDGDGLQVLAAPDRSEAAVPCSVLLRMLNRGKAHQVLSRRADGQHLCPLAHAFLEGQLSLSGVEAP